LTRIVVTQTIYYEMAAALEKGGDYHDALREFQQITLSAGRRETGRASEHSSG
jgi:hypothetical protein